MVQRLSLYESFNAQNNAAVLCHRSVRNHRLLSTVAAVKARGNALLLIPTGLALALFVWLLTLHPAASGRVYAAYGGVYVCTALLWLRVVDGVKLSHYDGRGDHRPVRHADHRGGLGAGLSPPCVIAATFLNLNSCMVVDLLPYLSDILFCYDSVRNNDGYRDTCRPDGGDAAAYPSGAEDHPDAAVYRRYRQLS
jgi:hypothetical protein